MAEAAAGNAEENTFRSSDSSLGDDDASSAYTESLRSSIFQSVIENGRAYHKYRDGQYFMPEDELEKERLDLQHELFLMTTKRKLFLAPRSDADNDEPHDVLDLGTGTGMWAMDYADEYPNANVLGIDLSPIQPPYVPPNCKFEIDDFDQAWTFTKKFDFVHGRMLIGCFGDPEALFQEAYDSLHPGGWFELQDTSFPVLCDDGTFEGTSFWQLNQHIIEGFTKIGRDPALPHKYKDLMVAAGFENVTEVVYKWPVNGWHEDKVLHKLGLWNMINTLDGIHGATARLITQVLGINPVEYEVMLAQTRKDIQNTNIHAYWHISFVYGQKPAA